MRRVEHLQAQPTKDRVQAMRRIKHLRAQPKKTRVQRIRRVNKLNRHFSKFIDSSSCPLCAPFYLWLDGILLASLLLHHTIQAQFLYNTHKIIGTLCALCCSPRSSPIHNIHISIIRCTAAAWSKGSACSCRTCRQCLTCKHVCVIISTPYNSLQRHVRCVKSALGW